MIITIDGPSASGKSTIARLLAEKLKFYYINTGLLYRALAYLLIQHRNYNFKLLSDPKQNDIQAIVDPQRLVYSYNKGPHILFDNQDITSYLKDAYIDKGASIISAVPLVREMLLKFQKDIARCNNIIVEGRDTGSVVFPHADYKFYLTAKLPIRAQRWLKMQQKRGNQLTLQEAIESIRKRDLQDSKRAISPLVIPEKAIVIDNSDMSEYETLQFFLKELYVS